MSPPPDRTRPPRLALLGDVHANLPALTAVLDAIHEAGIAGGLCTGDLVMRGAEPEACVRLIRGLGWPAVLGNTDRRVARSRPDPDHPKAGRVGSRAWTATRTSDGTRAYLGALPMVLRVRLGRLRVVAMHGTPDDPRTAVDESASDAVLRRLARSLDADVVVSGHTHRPFVRHVGDVLFVNPGSVGEGVPGERRPSWAVLEAGADGPAANLMRVGRDLAALRDRR